MLTKALAALLLAAAAVSGQESSSERYYQAIRVDDLSAVRALVQEAGVETRGSLGQTPLMMAVAFGSTEAVELLLKASADVKAATPSGVTALHWARGDTAKTRLLVEHGADVNARSQLGRTPLMVASASTGSLEAVRLLLGKGADVNAADNTGATPLTEATTVDQTDVVKQLLERGANVNPETTGVPGVTALLGSPLSAAAVNGNAELVRLLLSRGADVRQVSAANNKVKNGPIAFGNATALHMAAVGGNEQVARLLVDAGAPVDAKDVRGLTPLTLAIATDRPRAALIRLLLERGADAAVRSAEGDTPLDWARKFNNPAVLAELKQQPATLAVPGHTPVTPEVTARRAVERSLAVLRTTSNRMLATGGCVACHAQPITAAAIETARAHGVESAPAQQEALEITATLSAGLGTALQVVSTPAVPDAVIYSMMTLAETRAPANMTTDALVHVLAAKQQPDGDWGRLAQARPPIGDGGFSRTALAVRALKTYGTPARRRELDERIARAAGWLARERPLTTEDRVMQLLGLHWAGAHADVVDRGVKELITLQRPDGGWAQTPFLESDAYATGEALYTLRELSVPARVEALQKGTAFLLRTQGEDGSWHVKSRAVKIQPYFESGFPHGHDQWISQAGTAWASMALSRTAFETPTSSHPAR